MKVKIPTLVKSLIEIKRSIFYITTTPIYFFSPPTPYFFLKPFLPHTSLLFSMDATYFHCHQTAAGQPPPVARPTANSGFVGTCLLAPLSFL